MTTTEKILYILIIVVGCVFFSILLIQDDEIQSKLSQLAPCSPSTDIRYHYLAAASPNSTFTSEIVGTDCVATGTNQ